MQGPLEVQIQFVEFAIKEAIRWVPRGTTRLQAVDSLQWLAEGWRTCLVELLSPCPHFIVKAHDIDV